MAAAPPDSMQGVLPQRLEPMLAVLEPEAFDDPERIFEVKWDGVRALAFISRGRVRLQTRNFMDISAPFADIGKALLGAVRGDGIVLDGELVSPDENGVPRLPRVMRRIHDQARMTEPVPVNFEVFDVLYRGYQPVMKEPLMRRKALLKETLQANDTLHICHFEEEAGIAFFEAATRLGLEGVVAKTKNSIYTPGKRSRNWLKVKAHKTGNVVVGGYTIGGGARKELFGGLLVGVYDRKGLRFIGSVGGGFQGQDLDVLYSLVTKLHADECPFVEPPAVDRLLYWCQPVMVLSVKFGELTEDGHLRFPVFKGLRPDMDPRDCTLTALKASEGA